MGFARVTSSTNAVATGPGELYTIVVEGGGSAGSVELFDALTQTGTVIGNWPIPANSTVPIPWKAKQFATGLSITLTSVQGVELEWF